MIMESLLSHELSWIIEPHFTEISQHGSVSEVATLIHQYALTVTESPDLLSHYEDVFQCAQEPGAAVTSSIAMHCQGILQTVRCALVHLMFLSIEIAGVVLIGHHLAKDIEPDSSDWLFLAVIVQSSFHI